MSGRALTTTEQEWLLCYNIAIHHSETRSMSSLSARSVRLSLLLGSGIALVPAAWGQDRSGPPAPDHGLASQIQEIVITASPLSPRRADVVQGTAVLSGETLDRALSTSLGESLDRLPGLSQTGFGPAASRPVIRGLGGDRVRVLVGGIGSIDAATTSPDHASAADLATAKRVEVVRGPAALLYGANAVGGVVNILDGRVPIERPENAAAGLVRLGIGSVADERFAAGSLDVAAGSNLVLHADGFRRKAGDYDVPGFVESARFRAAEMAGHEEEEHGDHEEHPRDQVANSGLRQVGGTLGLSAVGSWGFFGASVGRLDSDYGIAGGHSHAEDAHGDGEEHGGEDYGEEESVDIDLEQTRVDLTGDIRNPLAGFSNLRVRFGWADYQHVELEGDAIGTRFDTEGWEGRLELVQEPMGRLSGAFGFQALSRDFSALGDEAFVPPSETRQYGIFAVQRLNFGSWDLEGGLRLERQTLKSAQVRFDNDSNLVSLSTGIGSDLGSGWRAGLSLSRTERAPNAEELLSNGPHLATGTFEVGDRALGNETAVSVEASLKRTEGPVTGALNLYLADYSGFIDSFLTGLEEDGLPVSRYAGTDARFIGGELELQTTLWQNGSMALAADGAVDYVRAENEKTGEPLPRIPPLSLRGGLTLQDVRWSAGIDVVWSDDQRRSGPFTLPTDGHTVLNATVDWHPLDSRDLVVTLQGRNLTDEEVRLATSTIKDRLPQPGRDLRLLLRAGF
jgi:iron complex outermembrane recepter protein